MLGKEPPRRRCIIPWVGRSLVQLAVLPAKQSLDIQSVVGASVASTEIGSQGIDGVGGQNSTPEHGRKQGRLTTKFIVAGDESGTVSRVTGGFEWRAIVILGSV